MALPRITATGNLVADPQIKITPNGTTRCTLRLACNDTKKVDGEWVNGEATYIDVILWRGLAEAAGELTKGTSVTIIGKLQVTQYQDKNGNTRNSVEVLADNIALTVKASKGKPQEDPWQKPVDEYEF